MLFLPLLVCFIGLASGMSQIHKRVYGSLPKDDGTDSTDILEYTLDNGKMWVEVITYGATITGIRVPDSEESIGDVALGFDDLSGFLSKENPYMGATVGRVANRITNGSFELDGVRYNISKNFPTFTLHGGVKGLDKYVWDSQVTDGKVIMSCVSPDGDMGFPGELRVQAIFSLDDDNTLCVEYIVESEKRTPVNIVNHVYLNLAGQEAGAKGMFEHTMQINADSYTELDKDSLPTGKILPVENTTYDLRTPSHMKEAFHNRGPDGFDINYAVQGTGFRQVAFVSHSPSGRTLDLWSNQPGVQFYSSNYLGGVHGKEGVTYEKYGAFCLETQQFPDAVNHPDFPSSIVSPGETKSYVTTFKFGVMK